MGINHHHEHLSLDWSNKVNVESLPGKGRVLPPMQGCMGRVIRQFLATLTASDCPFNVFVNVGLPNEAPGQTLQVAFVERIQHSLPQLGWNDHSTTPHQNSMMAGDFVTTMCIGNELWVEFCPLPS